MAFRNLTNSGKEYLATRLANELPVKFIKAKIGNGSVPLLTNPANTTDLYNFKKQVTILNAVQEQNSIKLTLQITNDGINEGFYLKEIGIYVDDNGKEVLYWYCNEDNSQYINAQSDIPIVFEIDIMMEVTNINSTIVEWTGKDTWISKTHFDEKVRTFEIPTVIELQSRKNLKVGDIVEVLGYYSAGDGAGHKRIISREDDGSGVQLANKLWANILSDKKIKVSALGAKGDGVTDDTNAIQLAFDLAGRINGIVEFERNKIYGVTAKNGIYISGGNAPDYLRCCILISGNVTVNGNNSTLLYLVTKEEYDNTQNKGGVVLCAKAAELIGKEAIYNSSTKNNGQIIHIDSLNIDGGFNSVEGALHSERKLIHCQGANFDCKGDNFIEVTLINCKIENTFAEGIRGNATKFEAIGCKFANSWPTSVNIRPKTGIIKNCIIETGKENSGLFEVFGTYEQSLFEVSDCIMYAKSNSGTGILALFASQNYDKQPTNKVVFRNNVIHIDRIKPTNKVGNIITIRGYDVEFEGNEILWDGENEYVTSRDSNQINIHGVVNLVARNNYFMIGETCAEFLDNSFFRYVNIDNPIIENNFVDILSNDTDKISPGFYDSMKEGWKIRYRISIKTIEDKIFNYKQFIKYIPMFKSIEIELDKSATISITFTPAQAYGNTGQELKICENEYIDSRIGKIIYKNIANTKATYLHRNFYIKGVSDVETTGTITFIV